LAIRGVKELAYINKEFGIGWMRLHNVMQKGSVLFSCAESLLLSIDLLHQFKSFLVVLLLQQLSEQYAHLIQPCRSLEIELPQNRLGFFGTVGSEQGQCISFAMLRQAVRHSGCGFKDLKSPFHFPFIKQGLPKLECRVRISRILLISALINRKGR